MTTAIIKYGGGNVQSVMNALVRLGETATVTADRNVIQNADRVIFPGVGHAANAMQYLHREGLAEVIVSLRQPVLGICLGMQLMCAHSEEGDTTCLNIFDVEVKLFPPENLKVPQVGWNNINGYASSLFDGLPANAFMYYVHSYFAAEAAETVATTDYILPYSAALQKDNFYAVQFHPEKSGTAGEQLLRNFLNIS